MAAVGWRLRDPLRGLVSLLLAMAAFAAESGPNSVLACSCGPNLPPLDTLEMADAVFVGSVSYTAYADSAAAIRCDRMSGGSQEPSGSEKRVVCLRVELGIKGVESDSVHKVETAGQGTACGFGFSSGEAYLIYARQGTSQLATSSCSRSRPIARAEEDFRELGLTYPIPPGMAPPTVRASLPRAEEGHQERRGVQALGVRSVHCR